MKTASIPKTSSHSWSDFQEFRYGPASSNVATTYYNENIYNYRGEKKGTAKIVVACHKCKVCSLKQDYSLMKKKWVGYRTVGKITP